SFRRLPTSPTGRAGWLLSASALPTTDPPRRSSRWRRRLRPPPAPRSATARLRRQAKFAPTAHRWPHSGSSRRSRRVELGTKCPHRVDDRGERPVRGGEVVGGQLRHRAPVVFGKGPEKASGDGNSVVG